MQAYIDEQHYISRRSFREDIHQQWGHRCAYCDEHLGDKPTLDHVHPKAKGGPYVWSNLVSACLRCNREKGQEDWIEWFRSVPWYDEDREAAILRWIEPSFELELERLDLP